MIAGLLPYLEMKSTGLPWLPELPTGWEIYRAKYSFREVDDRSVGGDEELLSVSHKTGVTPRSQKNITMFMAESYEGHKVCLPGDVVVNTMWAWMAAIGVSRHVGIVSPAYGIYRPRTSNRFEPKYLDYLLRTEAYRAEYLRSSRGITTSRLRLYPPDFLNIPFVQPPLDEQRLIVRFLDWHGALTAKLIRAKKKLIALLNEQKQAIIHRAVTRGLDPNVRLKPSGVEWIGDIPKHWEVKKLRFLKTVQVCEPQRGLHDQGNARSLIRKHVLCGVRDPAWRLRQASLHCERGEFSEASRLIGEALNELNKRQRENRASLWVRSRRAWAQYLARATRLDRFGAGAEDGWPLEFQEARCDPRQEIEAIEGETQKALRERREEEVAVVPLFKPGHYKDSSQTVRFRSSTVVDPAETLDHLAEVVGLPIRMAHVSLLGTIAKDTAELAFDPAAPSLFWYLRLFRAVHSRSDPLIDRYLGRVGVARLPLDVATALTGKITSAIAFWRSRVRKGRGDGKQDTFAVERLCLFIVVLSRLTARQDAQSARASFDLAMDLAVDPALTHVWEFEPIGLLAEHAAQAVPPDHRSDIVLKALLFPLSSEKGVDRRFGWPNPVAWLGDIRAVRPQDDAHWGDRIDELIKAAGAGLPERSEAAIRLGYLADSGALTDGERASFARAVWSESDGVEPALPAGTGLLPHIFALIPETDGVDVKAVVRTRLFERDDVANVGDRLYAIVAATSRKIEAIQPTREQALRMFGRMTAWRLPEVELGPLSAALSQGNIDRERRLIGQALALAVAPALSAEDRTEQRADALLALINMAGVETAIAALPYFICSAGESGLRQAVVQRIRLGFVGRSPDEVSGAAAAIETWVKSARQNHSPDLPRQLIEQVITAVEMRREIGLSTLVWCARRLVEEKALTPDDKGRLGAALGDLLVETAYERVDPRSWTAVTVSLVRAECVRLAQALRAEDSVMTETDAWLEAAAVDTLPEVRFLVANDPIQPDPH
jgi:hypothetical protein